MKLNDIATIKSGLVVSRAKITKEDNNAVEFKQINPSYISYFLGDISDLNEVKDFFEEGKIKQFVSKENQLLILASDGRSMVVENEFSNRIIPNNYYICEIKNEEIDIWYLCWYFNESKEFKVYKSKAIQGSALIKILPAELMFNTPIIIPSIEEQHAIGNLYKAFIKNKRNNLEIIERELKAINYVANTITNKKVE